MNFNGYIYYVSGMVLIMLLTEGLLVTCVWSQSFKVVSNSSVPCSTLLGTNTYMARRGGRGRMTSQITELGQEEMKEIMRHKGVPFLQGYMATTSEEADQTFFNLLPVTSEFRNLLQISRSRRSTIDTTNSTNALRDDDNLSQARKNVVGLLKKDIIDFLEMQQLEHPDKHFELELSSGKTGANAETEEQDDTESSSRLRSKRQTTTLEYCLKRGEPTPDGQFLHLCYTCTHKTTMPSYVWPPILNEAACNSTDNKCIYDEISANGECRDTELLMPILVKQPGDCVLALQNGQTIIINDWIPSEYRIRVGCECLVNKDSYFARFV